MAKSKCNISGNSTKRLFNWVPSKQLVIPIKRSLTSNDDGDDNDNENGKMVYIIKTKRLLNKDVIVPVVIAI